MVATAFRTNSSHFDTSLRSTTCNDTTNGHLMLSIGQETDVYWNDTLELGTKLITGWMAALTRYISHSAKHRKKADFDPSGSWNPLTNFDETWHGWLCEEPHPTRQLWYGLLLPRWWQSTTKMMTITTITIITSTKSQENWSLAYIRPAGNVLQAVVLLHFE